MSTLGQQLAAINVPGKNTGSTLAASRRHEDSIGRGLAHSVQVGHALHNRDHQYKPSIIHEDARKASDVPLATIRENCVSSLRHLETIDTEFGGFVGVLCQVGAKERGLQLAAENDKTDKSIEDLLYRISLVMGNNGSKSNNLVSCLNVIEFLLRKYDIHVRPKTASTMLLALLPHHEEPYFLRMLQLIDLASLPEWAFLRPYAIPGARLGRSILAQKASKDVALVRALGRLSQRNSKLPFSQQSLSFTAAVLVEALTLQTQRKGSMEEQTCQAILPFVVTACRNEQYYKSILNGKKYLDGYDGGMWQNWGYIMASTMVETGILASEPRSLLVTSVLHGLALQQEAGAKTTEKHGLKTSISSGLIVSLTILAQTSTDNSNIDKSDLKDSSYLPLLSPSMATSSTSMIEGKICGFSMMDKDIFNALLRLEGYDNDNKSHNKDTKSKNIKNSSKSKVAACIANLYHQDGMVDFEQWVASILVFGWKRFVKYHKQTSEQTDKKSNKAHFNCCKILNLALNLVKHSHLEKLWKQMDGQWVESFISFVFLNTPLSVFDDVKNDVNDTKDTRFSEEEYIKAILQTLRSLDGVAYERGITHALIQTKSNKDRMDLAKYLGLAKSKSSSDSGGQAEGKDTPTATSISLPPRVGLEHADYRIRLESISTLLEIAKDEENRMDVDADDMEFEGETTPLALFRRFLMDDNRQVALAAAKALDEILLMNNERSGNVIGRIEFSEGASEALYKWAQSPADEDKFKEQLLAHSCRFASYAVKRFRASNQTDLSFIRILEGLGALLSDSDSTVSLEAAKGIVAAFGQDKASKKADKVKKQATSLLISDDTILQGFRRVFRERNSAEFHIRRQVSRMVLDAISMADASTKISKETLEYNIWLIEAFGNDFSADEINALGKSLLVLSTRLDIGLENIHSTFCRLSSSEGAVFDIAVAPYIRGICENIKDKQGGDVSPIAIVMEVVLSSDSFDQIRNLLSVANEMASKDMVGNFYAFAPVLALCCHHEETIRRVAVSFLSHLSKRFSSPSNKEDWMVLIVVCQYISEKKSSVVLKGASFISESLATVLSHSKEAASIRKYLLQAIMCSVTAYGATDSVSSTDYFTKSWLDRRYLIGGYKTGGALLEVTESAGEAAFPILSRWEGVGQPLLSSFLSTPFCTGDEVSYYQSQFIHSVVKILRGATISIPSSSGISSTSTIITTGPSSHGRRARSYSFGKNDGVGALTPYPKNMQASIVSILTKKTSSSLHNEIRTCLFEIVLCSHSWRQKVFSHLNGKVRQKIASAMLVAAAGSLFHGVDSVLLSLPLDANDIAKLLCDQESNEVGLSKLTFISDFINANHSKLATSPGINELFASIFKILAGFSEVTKDSEPIEFARHALLSALLELIKSSLDLGSMNTDLGTKKKTFDSWLNTLVDTVIQKRNSSNHFVPLRSKRIIFLIFASLCDKYPKTVIPKFIPIITGLTSESLSEGEESTLVDCFDLVIPVYFKHAAAGNLSPIDLYRSFINYVCTYDEKIRPKFYMAFVHALSMIPENGGSEASPVGSFIAAVLARETYCPSDKSPTEGLFSKLPALATQILSHTSSDSRIQAVWTMQNYAKEILFNILHEETTGVSDAVFPVQHLIEIAVKGPNSTGKGLSKVLSLSSSVLDSLCSLLIIVTCEVVTSHESRNIIRHTDGSGSAIVLRLWQDLLLIQSACHNRLGGSSNHEKSELLERIVEITTQALECIQNSLPSHIFLAFVTSLVTEGETQELRARAVQLIAERSASSYLGKSEAVLFVEMIPPLLQLLVPSMSEDKNEDSNSEFLQQSVFAAIDSIGRNACLSSESTVNDRHLGIFSDATFKAASVLERRSTSNVSFLNIPSESRQLVSSVALCSSTAIKICGPRALPVLPKLIKPLLSFLVAASTFIESSISESDNVDKKELSQAKLMQLAIMRTFRSIVERMPKLLKPYLVDILETFAKVSGSFQSIQMEMVTLQNIMTSHIPSRQLIPAASKSIFSIPNVDLNLSTLSIMIESITNSKSSEVSGMISVIIKTATHVFDQDVTHEGGSAVMEAADELLLCLVMKLSEMQLRSLYRKIREWRGDLDESNPEQSAARRSAFWRFSSTLSKQLKSIYLSCLTTVFSDAIDELVSLCYPFSCLIFECQYFLTKAQFIFSIVGDGGFMSFKERCDKKI